MLKFKVEDVYLEHYGLVHIQDSLEFPTAWNYAEADRLERAAKDAIKAYNEYVQRQPRKVYLPMYLPD